MFLNLRGEMALFFKKKKEEPEGEELPPLPPLPGEEELKLPEIKEEELPAKIPSLPQLAPAPQKPLPTPTPTTPLLAEEKATVFVRLDKYKEIMRTISEMESKLSELKETLDKIAGIKSKEAEIIDGWAAMLSETKARLDEVSQKLTKPEV